MPLKFILFCLILLLTAFTTQPESRALPSGTVLATDWQTIWRINLESKTRTVYYQPPSGMRFQGYFIDYAEQVLYAVEVPDSINWWQWQFGLFDLVKIDLVSGEKTTLYTGEDIGINIVAQYPNSKDYILLQKYSHDYTYNRVPPTTCLLDVTTASCEQIPEDVVRTLAFRSTVIWLDPFTFTTGNRIINLLTGDSQPTPVTKWNFYYPIPFQSPDQFLVIARPQSVRFSDETGAGIYILDTDTFQLSEKICDVPPFTSIYIPQLSSDGRFIEFFWELYLEEGNLILDLETCQSVMAPSGVFSLSWLSGNHQFIGQTHDEGNPVDVVLVDANTGAIETLFQSNERLYFSVVP